jgi:hypothetical protein
MQPYETKVKEFKLLAKQFKKEKPKNKQVLIDPYKNDIYKLRFEKKASFTEIQNLFKILGIEVSSYMIGEVCKKRALKEDKKEVKFSN